jgi:cytochrome bd-type quinol oxidase subunit 2
MAIKFGAAGVLFIVVTGVVLFTLNPDGFFESDIFSAYIYAALINAVNFLLALFFVNAGSNRKNNSEFLKFTLGGMILRIFFIVFSIFIFIKFLNIEKSGFILIFFIIYFVLLIVEILFYKKKLTEK